jgi:hypothetical protein
MSVSIRTGGHSSAERMARLSLLPEIQGKQRIPIARLNLVEKAINLMQRMVQKRRLAAKGNATSDICIRHFEPGAVNTVVYDILCKDLRDKTYDSKACSELAQQLTNEIQRDLKSMRYPRYKFVTQVVIGEKRAESSIIIGSRCVWNQRSDNYTSARFSNHSLFAVATVYAVFHE